MPTYFHVDSKTLYLNMSPDRAIEMGCIEVIEKFSSFEIQPAFDFFKEAKPRPPRARRAVAASTGPYFSLEDRMLHEGCDTSDPSNSDLIEVRAVIDERLIGAHHHYSASCSSLR